MGVLKWIGYIAAAILVLIVLTIGGAMISALVTVLGVVLIGAAVVAFVAFCIKDYCESRSNRP